MKFLHLVHVVLILPAAVLLEVISFKNCDSFFVGSTFPTIFKPSSQYKQICQKYNMYEFATLYDITNRIPVYSAYRYQGKASCKRMDNWLIEPQLDDQNADGNMAPETSVNESIRGENQALNKDYAKSGFDKGHLYPVFHTFQDCSVKATFTLTNAAPQNRSFNRGEWFRKVEQKTKDILDKYCIANFTYVVTGVVPGNEQIKGRVTVPDFFWSSYCCLDNNLKPLYSAGYISPNKKGEIIGPILVSNLERTLSDQNHYNKPFSVFGGLCGDNIPPNPDS